MALVDEESPLAQLRDDVADLLAVLSSEEDSPSSFELRGGSFDRSDVDFDTDSWIRCIVQVQGWLGIRDPLPDTSRADFATALAAELGFDDISAALLGGTADILGPVALDRLRERAEKAVRIQRRFADEFQSDRGSVASASRVWEVAWEESVDDDEVVSPDPVSAKAETWRIEQYVALARDKKLNLSPSYQRGDVWSTSARQLLIESILRGIPLPSVILLRKDGKHEVVDGKQRLTSILRFVGKHPLAIARVRDAATDNPELLELFSNNYPKFKSEWRRIFNEPLSSSLEERYYFPFKLRTDDRGLPGETLAPLRGKYYTQIKNMVIQVADLPVEVEEVFERSTEYTIPVIVYNRANQRQIHEVFNLYNRQGMHLNAEEIRNAIYNELDLARGILVAAGDSDPRTPISEIASFLEPGWTEIQELQQTLRGYGFGESRYRRTKVLSWVLATLLQDSGERLPSTARHIDALLDRIQEQRQDPLRDGDRIRQLVEWIARSAEVHSAYGEAWAPNFMDGGQGVKWQELQLVGSLVGVAAGTLVLGAQTEERFAGASSEMREASEAWIRPAKTQTRTQWEFISLVAREVVEIMGVDHRDAARIMREEFGSSGIETLWAVAPDVQAR
jgi:hypothetical protein